MTSIDDLPAELRLRILAHLPLQPLLSVRLTCRRWNEFVVANTSAIYRNAAAAEGFIESSETSIAQALADARYIRLVPDDSQPPDWYTFCRVSAIYRDVSKLSPLIRGIFAEPTTDLNVVNMRDVRRAILKRDPYLSAEFMSMKKGEVGEVISEVFQDFTSPTSLGTSA
ncbi:hypothetical protein FKP32DRAFT_1675498 [Trametes sanguinea]|nr:hypothetical protein FKP32DRAFT_1675498 [Trametes sanguinea]